MNDWNNRPKLKQGEIHIIQEEGETDIIREEREIEIIREELENIFSGEVEIFEPNLRKVEDILDAIEKRRDQLSYKHPCNLTHRDTWTKFELGMLHGELSALRWAIGKEWRDIDLGSQTTTHHE